VFTFVYCLGIEIEPRFREKKQRQMKFQVGQRVDFKKYRGRIWIAGRVTEVDQETRVYTVVDGKGFFLMN
jgi:hypothetical protein